MLSIVTPSFNQARFLEGTIRSVLNQGYPRLQYLVVDGASTDHSVEIIRRHADRIHWWVSERDSGPEEAINKGFARTTGEIMGWIGSSDGYLPWALRVVGQVFRRFPEVEWLTTLYPIVHWDEAGRASECFRMPGYHREGFLRAEYLNMGRRWHARGWIQAESTFWRRTLWERAGGGIDPRVHASDFDLWARFYEHAPLWGVGAPLAFYRIHTGQRAMGSEDAYLASALDVLKRHGGRPRCRIDTSFRIKRMSRIPAWCRVLFDRLGWVPRGPAVVCGGPGTGWIKEQQPILGAYASVPSLSEEINELARREADRRTRSGDGPLNP